MNLLPRPLSFALLGEEKFRITPDLKVTLAWESDAYPRAEAAVTRLKSRLAHRTNVWFDQSLRSSYSRLFTNELVVSTSKRGEITDVDANVGVSSQEGYTIQVTAQQVLLTGNTDIGVIHGIETLLQCLLCDADGFYWPVLDCKDAPRFPWRGLMIDPCRHWMPVEVVKRNLDGMAAVKMNVLHLHLTEDQGFRIESKSFPNLHREGSLHNQYYTQDQMKEIIRYAEERCIRVVPEFDMPSHMTSWFCGHPELSCSQTPKKMTECKAFGYEAYEPMDPTREENYSFLETFLAEMCALFPDKYFHFGGDEVRANDWNTTTHIQDYIKEKGLKSNNELQAVFTRRMIATIQKFGKTPIGWDEILSDTLPKGDVIIQGWRKNSLYNSTSMGFKSILSRGWYLDLCQTVGHYYSNRELASYEQARANSSGSETGTLIGDLIGGEATMWTEIVSPESVDSRIWPHTAAIADVLWSQGAQNQDDEAKSTALQNLHERLDSVSVQLEEHGLTHIKNRAMMMRRLIPSASCSVFPLEVLSNAVRPVEKYQRHDYMNTHSPLGFLADFSVSDPLPSRRFMQLTREHALHPFAANSVELKEIEAQLNEWATNADALARLALRFTVLSRLLPLSESLATRARLGQKLLNIQVHKFEIPFNLDDWREQDRTACVFQDKHLGVQFAFSLESLFNFAQKSCDSK